MHLAVIWEMVAQQILTIRWGFGGSPITLGLADGLHPEHGVVALVVPFMKETVQIVYCCDWAELVRIVTWVLLVVGFLWFPNEASV